MKMLMFTSLDIEDKRFIGVLKKINGQMKGFESYGIKSDFIYSQSYYLVCNINNSLEFFIPSSTKDKYNRIIDVINKNKYDLFYIRYPLSDFYFIDFLERLKETNKQIKIILEFPTFPYDAELERESNKLFIDKHFRKYLCKYIDLAVSYHTSNDIFEIPTIKIQNGIDVNSIPLTKNLKSKEKILNMIAVANISKWHGYDRIIYGLHEYYSNHQTMKVHFNIIGIGDELNTLIDLVNKLNLNGHVHFYGAQTGEALNRLYVNNQIAIASLGLHRIGIYEGDTLKAREYCARGIPFVIGYNDTDLKENFKYILRTESNEDFIDINKILDFYNDVYKDKNVRDNMRAYAEKNLTWKSKLQLIINKINIK